MSDTTDAVEKGTTENSLPTEIPEHTLLPTNPDENDSGNTGVNDDPNSVEQAPFDLAEPYDLRFTARGRRGNISVRHVLSQPSLQALMERDAAQPYRSQMVSDDIERPIADVGNTADEKLYNRLVTHTEGYKLNVREGQSAEERQAALSNKNIPKQHKKNVINQIVQFDVKYVIEPIPESDDNDEEEEVFQWGENLTYKFAVEFGPEGLFKATVVMNSPSDEHIDHYHEATSFEIEKGFRKPVTRMLVDLKPVVVAFDELMKSADGFVVKGEPFDVGNPMHVKLISGYLKRAVMAALIKETGIVMGK